MIPGVVPSHFSEISELTMSGLETDLSQQKIPTPMEIFDAIRKWDRANPAIVLRFKCEELDFTVPERWLILHSAYEMEETLSRVPDETIVLTALANAIEDDPEFAREIESIEKIYEEFSDPSIPNCIRREKMCLKYPGIPAMEWDANETIRYYVIKLLDDSS
jgi:hypothetical protein